MYLFPFIQGLGLGLGMIVPIGAQNAYLINQGIRRNFHLLAATVCLICDVMLIGLGIFGAGEFLSRNPLALQIMTVAGIIFLSVYGTSSFKKALKGVTTSVEGSNTAIFRGKRGVLLGALAVTLLNPHAYLDTMVILGSVGNQMEQELRLAFALGTFSASFIWFFSLSSAAAKFAPWLSKPGIQRIIDFIVAFIMWAIALSLVKQFI